TRRVPHVYDIAADPGAALFAGLTALPKVTALTTYSYRLEHSRQAAFLTALDKAALAAALAAGAALNLDFHVLMHCGDDPVLHNRQIGLLPLRAPTPCITKALAALPASTWTSMTLGRAGNKTRRIKVHDDPQANLSAYPRPIRQLAVTGLGHDQPTLLITNR